MEWLSKFQRSSLPVKRTLRRQQDDLSDVGSLVSLPAAMQRFQSWLCCRRRYEYINSLAQQYGTSAMLDA